MTFTKRIATAAAFSALLVNTLANGAFAATTLTISGNGSSSNNTSNVSTTMNTTVVQSNTADIKNNVTTNANTGGNHANDNTGGDVTVRTGNATSNATVSTQANLNKAVVNNCNCEGNATVTISGNGTGSRNDATLESTRTTDVFQNNAAHVENNVNSNAESGNNDANRNTGGHVTVWTGNAASQANVSTSANANIATVGGGTGAGARGASVDLTISGNGSNSVNSLNLDLDRSILLAQSNSASVDNNVEANAKTGENHANDNTGGDTTVHTGNADARATVDTAVNFNAADISCDCLGSITGKVAGNGTSSRNDLTADISGDLSVFQGCGPNMIDNILEKTLGRVCADVNNTAHTNAKTGNSDANRNTGPVLTDPTSVRTGDASTRTDVSTSGNVNLFGPGARVQLPHGGSMDFHFNLNGLLSFLGLI